MHHEHRQHVRNPDGVSDSPRYRVNAPWPGAKDPHQTVSSDERREIPVTDPAEIAEFADAAKGTEESYVEISADPLGDGEASQIELDAD